jgi:dTMP kinase
LAADVAGCFITFEGGEGAGKSTQIKRLAAHFQARKRDVVLTREPGGTTEAEAVRNSTAEALLNYAARDSHVQNVIRPALAFGKTVLSDRFMDSTRAYQAYGGDCPITLIDALEHQVVGPTRPDVTFIFDLPPELGLERARNRGAGLEDRYERKGLAFHEKLRRGFLAIAQSQPGRCHIIDASQTEDIVWLQILTVLTGLGHG